MTDTPFKLVVGGQEALSNELMVAIRKEIMSPRYDRMQVSTLIGVLEMLKIEMYGLLGQED